MTSLDLHPTVLRHRAQAAAADSGDTDGPVDAEWLAGICLAAGADDVGFVSIARPEIDDQRTEIVSRFPFARTLISIVCRMNREPIRSLARSAANLEFHGTDHHTNDAARRIVAALEAAGHRAVNPAMGFPMEMERFPGRTWVVSHKPVAVAAGLGRMGIHRNVIHPRFGNFILLATIVTDAKVAVESGPIDYNPCLECKLCVAACPVGAIGEDGRFNFSSCYTHNYREFMGGFADWVETIAASGSAAGYRSRMAPSETASMWQSLSFGANYKAAYCMAVCPAGDDVITPFLRNRKAYLDAVVRPLQRKVETVYVVPNSDAEAHVAARFPHKRMKRVGNGLGVPTARAFLDNLPHVFQPGRARDLSARYHFTFTGAEALEATVVIADQRISVEDGHVGRADLALTADSETWVAYLAKERRLPWALIRRRVRITGNPRLLLAFGKCFPG